MFSKKRNGSAIIIIVFALFAIFSFAALAIDLGIIFNYRYELEKATETAALMAISEYEPYENATNQITYPTTQTIQTKAINYFFAFIHSNSFLTLAPDNQFSGNLSVSPSRAISLSMRGRIKTYFLSALGIKTVLISSSAYALNVPIYLNDSNILKGDNGSYQDTQIRVSSEGGVNTKTIVNKDYTLPYIDNVNKNSSNLKGFRDAFALALGAGGFVTIKLPSIAFDGKGFDFEIIQSGNAKGYYVFGGNDIDPNNPYINANSPGGGIQWVNLSCTGTPIESKIDNTAGHIGSYYPYIGVGPYVNPVPPVIPKFYGSGYFDLGAKCTNFYGTTLYNANVASIKYLKIIDDNTEDGFYIKDQKYAQSLDSIPAFFLGDSSSITPGVNLDSIGIFHHPKLISSTDFTTDSDGDGLINVLESAITTNPNSAQSGTMAKLYGDPTPNFASPLINISGYATSTLRIGYPQYTADENPPKMLINSP